MFSFPHTENNFLTRGSLAELPKHSQPGEVGHTKSKKLDVSVSQQNLLMGSHEASPGKGSEHKKGREWGSPTSPLQSKEAPGYGEKNPVIPPLIFFSYFFILFITRSLLPIECCSSQEEQGRTKWKKCSILNYFGELTPKLIWFFAEKQLTKWQEAGEREGGCFADNLTLGSQSGGLCPAAVRGDVDWHTEHSSSLNKH